MIFDPTSFLFLVPGFALSLGANFLQGFRRSLRGSCSGERSPKRWRLIWNITSLSCRLS